MPRPDGPPCWPAAGGESFTVIVVRAYWIVMPICFLFVFCVCVTIHVFDKKSGFVAVLKNRLFEEALHDTMRCSAGRGVLTHPCEQCSPRRRPTSIPGPFFVTSFFIMFAVLPRKDETWCARFFCKTPLPSTCPRPMCSSFFTKPRPETFRPKFVQGGADSVLFAVHSSYTLAYHPV